MLPHLKDPKTMLLGSPEDGAVAYQVDGEVTAHRAYNGYGP